MRVKEAEHLHFRREPYGDSGEVVGSDGISQPKQSKNRCGGVYFLLLVPVYVAL